MLSLRLLHRGVGFVSTLILARLLVPQDFGLVAMATVLHAFLSAITDFSVHVPLIQKPHLDRADMDSAWTVQVIVGLVQGLLLLVLAGPVAAFYNEPRVTHIVQVLAAIAALQGFKNIGVVMFQRELLFHREFQLIAFKRLATFALTISLALILRTYWALVMGMLAGAFVELGISYAMHPFRPRLSRDRWGELFSFSKWLILNNILIFIGHRGPELVLGRMLGSRAVGLFALGYEVGTLPTAELVAPINRAVLPGYSRLQETEGGLRQGYLDVLGFIALLAIPASVGLAATAEILIPLLLGSNWLDAIPVTRYLALTGAVGVLMTNNGAVYLSLGKPWLITLLLVCRLSMLVLGMLAGAAWGGVSGVAMAYTIVEGVMILPQVWMLLRVIPMPLTAYVTVVYRPMLASAVMYAVLNILVIPRFGLVQQEAQLAPTAMTVIAGAMLYVSVIFLLWWARGCPAGAERRLLRLLSELWYRKGVQVTG